MSEKGLFKKEKQKLLMWLETVMLQLIMSMTSKLLKKNSHKRASSHLDANRQITQKWAQNFLERESPQETVTTQFTKHLLVCFLMETQVTSREENPIKMNMFEKWKEAKFHLWLGDNLILKICGLTKISLFKERHHRFVELIFQIKEVLLDFQRQRILKLTCSRKFQTLNLVLEIYEKVQKEKFMIWIKKYLHHKFKSSLVQRQY
mgnify:FL=1